MKLRVIGVMCAVQFLYLSCCTCQEENEETIENERNCRERNRLITSDNGDIYALIDVTVGQDLILQCHYWYALNIYYLD